MPGSAETRRRGCGSAPRSARAGSCGAASPKAANGWTRSWPWTCLPFPPESGARPRWSARSSPCPAIRPRPSRWPAQGLKLCRDAGDQLLDRGRAEPAQRDHAAHGADRRGGGLRERSAFCRAGGRRRVERGLRARHPSGGSGPGGQAARGRAAGQRLGERDAPDRPAMGGRPGPARPGRPGPAPRSPGRGARLVRGGAGHPAGNRRPAGDRTLPGRTGPGRHGSRRDRAGPAAPDQEPAAQPFHRRAHRRGPRARDIRGPGGAREPARAGRAADRGGHHAARGGRAAAAAWRADGKLPGPGATFRRRGRRPAVGARTGPEQRGRGRAGPGPAAGHRTGRRGRPWPWWTHTGWRPPRRAR